MCIRCHETSPLPRLSAFTAVTVPQPESQGGNWPCCRASYTPAPLVSAVRGALHFLTQTLASFSGGSWEGRPGLVTGFSAPPYQTELGMMMEALLARPAADMGGAKAAQTLRNGLGCEGGRSDLRGECKPMSYPSGTALAGWGTLLARPSQQEGYRRAAALALEHAQCDEKALGTQEWPGPAGSRAPHNAKPRAHCTVFVANQEAASPSKGFAPAVTSCAGRH